MKIKKRSILLVLVLLTPFWMWLAWVFTPWKPINIYVLDKTVLTKECDEHRSLNWVLEHFKYVKPNMEPYIVNQDYMGFFPLQGDDYYTEDIGLWEEEVVDSLANGIDMLFYTDVYGIYEEDWFGTKSKRSNTAAHESVSEDDILGFFRRIFEKNAALDRSQLIYGGLNQNEANLLSKLKSQKKLIITEFNLIASPTPWKIRRQVEEEFNFKWTGWAGRYFDDLDTTDNHDLPPWVVHLYMEQHSGQWPFKDAGIVIVHEDETIVILDETKHLEDEVPVIYTNDFEQDRFGLPKEVIYPFWFDIIETTNDYNNIISTYKILSNPDGDSILTRHGIPKVFPAVIEQVDGYKFYYFAGDFSDNPIEINWLTKMKGIRYLRFFLYNQGSKADRNRFFWNYYSALMSHIMEDYYKGLHPKQES